VFENVEAFYRPESIREAVQLLQGGKGHARVVAGGTDLIVDADSSVRVLIDLTRAGLSYIRRRDLSCIIGATSTMAEIESSEAIRALAGGLLAKAAATCGSVQLRNMATLGGNLAHGSPAADLAAPLLALEATVTLADANGRRKLPMAEYLAGVRSRSFSRSLLVEIVVPEPPRAARSGWSFHKLGRTAVDIAIVSVAAGLQLDLKGRIKRARIALGAVAPTPFRAAGAEALLTGRTLEHAALAEACEEVMREVDPISDQRASADYRRELSRVLTGRALEECARAAGMPL
jgi:carbon-monoxide dehydrogenase medium subunit